MRSVVLVACLAVAVLLAGCSAPTDPGGGTGEPTSVPETAGDTSPPAPTPTSTSTPTPTPTATPTPTPTPKPDPAVDEVGWENGLWYDDPIEVRAEDGLNDTEFAAAKARTMARVEQIRDREFENNVSVTFITRETLLERGVFRFRESRFRDTFWEAAFVVGEDRSAATALNELYSVVVDGYSYKNRVVIVAENPDSPRIDHSVLSHEMAHALGGPPVRGFEGALTRDEFLARRSVSESNAHLVESIYTRRCGSEWDCIERPPNASAVENFDVDVGLYLQFSFPYTVGPSFMRLQYDRGGMAAVDDAYRDPPTTTEAWIHPEKYGEGAPSVSVADRTSGDWTRMVGAGDKRVEEFGEAMLYVTLNANGVIDGPDPDVNKAQRTGLNYTHPASAGWDGDAVALYSNGTAQGYVFASEWNTTADAREFVEAYRDLLESKGAREVRRGVYRIPEGPYADAFRVTRDGRRVVVVNAPTVDALDAVHAPN